MFERDSITEMEKTLSEHGVSVAELCRRAEIAETTWGRWKRGDFLPSFRAWGAVSKAYDELVSEAASGNAA